MEAVCAHAPGIQAVARIAPLTINVVHLAMACSPLCESDCLIRPTPAETPVFTSQYRKLGACCEMPGKRALRASEPHARWQDPSPPCRNLSARATMPGTRAQGSPDRGTRQPGAGSPRDDAGLLHADGCSNASEAVQCAGSAASNGSPVRSDWRSRRRGLTHPGQSGRIAAMGPAIIKSDGELLAVPLAGGARRARTAE